VLCIERRLWEVRAICEDTTGRAAVLDLLETGSSETQAARRFTLALLREHIPNPGPPRGDMSAPLGDGIFELRRQPKKGPKLRVLYFYDETLRRVVVFTHGFFKDQRRAPEEIQRARELRAKYYAAIAEHRLEIVDLTA
jgi:hypothetical protein